MAIGGSRPVNAIQKPSQEVYFFHYRRAIRVDHRSWNKEFASLHPCDPLIRTYGVFWNFDRKEKVVTVRIRVPSDWVIEQPDTYEFSACTAVVHYYL